MNDTWGYKKSDQNWKSTAEPIGELVETSSKGDNCLLNIGPTALWEVPQAIVVILPVRNPDTIDSPVVLDIMGKLD